MYNTVQTLWVPLDKVYKAQYVKLVETSSTNGGTFGAYAEFYLTMDHVKATTTPTMGLQASAMHLNGVRIDPIDGGKRVVCDRAPTP